MKLTIKTLAKSSFTVEIEPEKTVKELKEKIETEQGKDYPYSAQKLIYSGKILADENKLSEYEFDEKKFVVLMITRPPPAPKSAPTASTAGAATTTAATESKSKPTTDDKLKPAATSTATVSSAPSSGTTSTTTSASQQTTATTTTESRFSQAPSANEGFDFNAANARTGSDGSPYDFRLSSLMQQPQFRQIQDLIQQSPHLLSSTIESLAATDPEMYSFMSDNPDIFVNALNHPPMAGSRRTNTQSQSSMGSARAAAAAAARAAAVAAGQEALGGSQQAVGGPGGRQQPVVDSILHNVSEHDREAIERLKELGFSEYLAFQAYMACDKDEQLAANLLFQMDQ